VESLVTAGEKSGTLALAAGNGSGGAELVDQPMRVWGVLAVVLLICIPPFARAHRSGCHRWHSCPSDRGTYVCGDLGYCSACPDNQYCEGGRPRAREPKQSRPLPAPERQQIISRATIQITQQRLKEFGYDPGVVDGMFGSSTKQALRRFQAESGLQVTGELDHETARRLGIELD